MLHAVALTAFVLVYDQVSTEESAEGLGVEIQLISSEQVSDQHETELAAKKSAVEAVAEAKPEVTADPELEESTKLRQASVKQLTVKKSEAVLLASDLDEVAVAPELEKPSAKIIPVQKNTDAEREVALITRSTNAVSQQQAILSLLHKSISSNKEYPYIARRQRREGVATVGFVLFPDGSVKNTHLVTSSSAGVLDRAAITAVKGIEPFQQAQYYLEQAEEFKIDVVFNLL